MADYLLFFMCILFKQWRIGKIYEFLVPRARYVVYISSLSSPVFIRFCFMSISDS